MSTAMLRGYINVGEAATVLGLSRQGVYDLIRRGQLQTLTVGRYWVVLRSDVERLRDERAKAKSDGHGA